MKRLALGLVMSAALVLGSTLAACGGSECDKQCDKFIRCWKDLSGHKLQKPEKQLRTECKQQCKKDKNRLKKDLQKICG